MKNKGNKQGQVHSRFAQQKKQAFLSPVVLNMDELAMFTDDILLEKLQTLEAERDRVLEARQDPRLWEIEAAYIRREMQLRRTRHIQHNEYLQQLDREAQEAAALENKYPVADLDNSAFMFFN